MNIVRWQRPVVAEWPSVARLSDLRSEIDRLFDAPLTELVRTSNLLSGWTPALDVYEDKDTFTVKAELWYQPIGFRWARNAGDHVSNEAARFNAYFSEMAEASGIVLAKTAATVKN